MNWASIGLNPPNKSAISLCWLKFCNIYNSFSEAVKCKFQSSCSQIFPEHTRTVSFWPSFEARLCTRVVFPVPVSPTKRTGSLYLTEQAILSSMWIKLRISTKCFFSSQVYNNHKALQKGTKEYPALSKIIKVHSLTALWLRLSTTLPICKSDASSCRDVTNKKTELL